MILGKFMRRLVAARGYALVPLRDSPRGFERFLAYARRAGLKIETAIDVGVGYGTPWLYEAFPEAFHVLIEPLTEYRKNYEKYESNYRMIIHNFAVGEENSEMEIMIKPEMLSTSTLSKIKLDAEKDIDRAGFTRLVPIKRLDCIEIGKPPYLLKIDAEGFELNALRGATNILNDVNMIIVETSIVPMYENNVTLRNVWNFLDEHDFILLDFADISNYRHSLALGYVDAVFVRKDSVLLSWNSIDN